MFKFSDESLFTFSWIDSLSMQTDHFDIVQFFSYTFLAEAFHSNQILQLIWLSQRQQTKSILLFSQTAKWGISRDSSKFLYYDTYKYLKMSILHTLFSDNVKGKLKVIYI